jgi:hypothetical protein
LIRNVPPRQQQRRCADSIPHGGCARRHSVN